MELLLVIFLYNHKSLLLNLCYRLTNYWYIHCQLNTLGRFVNVNNHGSLSTYIPTSQRYDTSLKSSKGSDEHVNSKHLQNDQGYLADSECTSNLSNDSTNSATN
jgi:hypothetical protein